MGKQMEPVLLIGDRPLTNSIASCLRQAGCVFTGVKRVPDEAKTGYGLAILITEEDLEFKKTKIAELEKVLDTNAIIAVNTETIGLDTLQRDAAFPRRIIGVNWTEPADTTFFLEIIANDITDPELADQVCHIAVAFWQKDPYVIHGNTGIRMRLMAAMIREAFYLVENGYATVEDIDRACRNDAGYYLPFAGNLRYMDLMGTYAYGMVMKDLNPELSKDTHIPAFFQEMLLEKEWGMEGAKGFYTYSPGENKKWQALLGKFGGEVKELMDKYPFKYNPEEVADPVRNGFNFR
jgi:3-hydroxybutyryl-CoA dehydrogenase